MCYCFNLDEELRKKYDVYGEEGLKDDHFDGGHYQSWNYFNEEFGKIVAFTEEMSCFNFIFLFELNLSLQVTATIMLFPLINHQKSLVRVDLQCLLHIHQASSSLSLKFTTFLYLSHT